MFTAGGQLDRLTFGGIRGGGGKGGGGGQSAPPQGRTYVDPVDGTVFAASVLAVAASVVLAVLAAVSPALRSLI